MKRRRFFTLSFKAIIGGFASAIMGLKPAAASDPVSVFEMSSVEQILTQLFATNQVGEDASIDIEVVREVQHREFVPFRISAPAAEKIAVIVDNNPQPLVMTMDVVGNCNGIIGILQMNTASYISCYVMKQGQLYRAARWAGISASGYED